MNELRETPEAAAARHPPIQKADAVIFFFGKQRECHGKRREILLRVFSKHQKTCPGKRELCKKISTQLLIA
jgi:hypothetical protein